jgi:hypothetical protein
MPFKSNIAFFELKGDLLEILKLPHFLKVSACKIGHEVVLKSLASQPASQPASHLLKVTEWL